MDAATDDLTVAMMLPTDSNGIVQRWNECATETFEFTAEEIIGENIKAIMPDDVAEKHDGYLERYMATGVKHVIGTKRCVLTLLSSTRLPALNKSSPANAFSDTAWSHSDVDMVIALIRQGGHGEGKVRETARL